MTQPPRRLGGPPAVALAILALLLPDLTPYTRAEQVSEEQLQATMLLQVMKFVEWPPQNIPSQMRICILGGGRFQAVVEVAAKNDSWRGRPISVSAIEKVSQADDCHIAFIAAASERDIQSLIDRQAKPVLTVSHRDGFARRGGMVNFVSEQGRIGLEVNPGAGERSGIRFSSKLLRLVRVVQSGGVN
ncbi:MAG: YfiR family protein [Acidobacteriota bacterium]